MVEQSTFQSCVGSTPTLISGMTGSGQQALCDGVTGNWFDSNKTYQCFLNSIGRVLSLQDKGYRFEPYREHQWQCGVMVSQKFAKLSIVYSVYQFDSGLCRQVKYQRSKAMYKHFAVSDIYIIAKELPYLNWNDLLNHSSGDNKIEAVKCLTKQEYSSMAERSPDKTVIQVQFLMFLPIGHIVQKLRYLTVTEKKGEHYPL